MSSRQHRKLSRKVESYLDGEADAPEMVEVRRHLAECWKCSQDAEWTGLMKTSLRRLGARQPTDLAAARLRRFASSLAES